MDNKTDQTLIQLNESLTVLYVEDSDIVRESTYDMMKEFFTHVDVAVDGADGLQKYKEFHEEHDEYYDIVFTDINMPKMNGIEFLTVAKKDDDLKSIPVIVLTTSHEDQDRIQSFNLGVAGYMLKPVNYQRFIEMVRTIDMYWTLSELPFGNEYNGSV